MEESTQLFTQAATLMLVGMVFVFGFLSLLIFVIKLAIAPLASKYPDPEPQARPTSVARPSENERSTSIVAAISAAVYQYRNKHRK